MNNPFLHTEWKNLIMVNYEVSPDLLKPYLPYGTELDNWNGKYYVSVVGFKFLNTKVKGIRFPYHINFEQVNLRFYVKRTINGEEKKGVVFIKEIIDRRLVKFVARTLYKENYVQYSMKHAWNDSKDQLDIKYQWKLNGKWNSIAVKAKKELANMAEGSEEKFIAEHYWGYVQIEKEKSYQFKVEHPSWKMFAIEDYHIDVDFKACYGKSFEMLQHQKPTSVLLVEGSEVSLGDRISIV